MTDGQRGSPASPGGEPGTWWQPDNPVAPLPGPPTGPSARPARGKRATWIIVACLAVLLSVVGIVVAVLAGVGQPGPNKIKTATDTLGTPTPTPSAKPQGNSAGTAVAALAGLVIAGDTATQTYVRTAFGPAWTDTDRNGCDTRNDVLRRDLTAVTLKPGTHGCVVASGTLLDPYSGAPIPFQRGDLTIQIDHVVSLGDAWRAGASTWPYAKLLALANDPLELLAVDSRLNEAKGDSDAASWLPPKHACDYAARQVAVKSKFELTVTQAEHDALAATLKKCPTEALPSGGNPTLAPNRSPAPRQTVLSTSPPSPPVAGAGTDPDYGTCASAHAHGAGPYYEGRDPEYSFYDDRDHDGVVCE